MIKHLRDYWREDKRAKRTGTGSSFCDTLSLGNFGKGAFTMMKKIVRPLVRASKKKRKMMRRMWEAHLRLMAKFGQYPYRKGVRSRPNLLSAYFFNKKK